MLDRIKALLPRSIMEIGHEVISTVIQVGQLSVTGERICTK